ncbi:MAG: fructose-bisphosphate aldolase, partial [Candidatus Thorarchaeota archaeon]
VCMEKGATGLIFGRNIWQREWDDAMAIAEKLKTLMR